MIAILFSFLTTHCIVIETLDLEITLSNFSLINLSLYSNRGVLLWCALMWTSRKGT